MSFVDLDEWRLCELLDTLPECIDAFPWDGVPASLSGLLRELEIPGLETITVVRTYAETVAIPAQGRTELDYEVRSYQLGFADAASAVRFRLAHSTLWGGRMSGADRPEIAPFRQWRGDCDAAFPKRG